MLLDDVRTACDDLAGLAGVADARERLDGPLRLAVAGLPGAGASTIVNALLGQRVAPTDGGERTTVPMRYRRGDDLVVLDTAGQVLHADAYLHVVARPGVAADGVDPLALLVAHDAAGASAANAVAVLSRADELGGDRPDSLLLAARVAARGAHVEAMRSRCAAVVPVAGLAAEAGRTLTDDEAADLTSLAAGDDIAEAAVDHLLARLGAFGLRVAVASAPAGAAGMRQALVGRSGIAGIATTVERYFEPHAAALKARSAIRSLRELAPADPAVVALDAVEADDPGLATLRVRELLGLGAVELPEDERRRARILAGPGSALARLGVPDDFDRAAAAATARKLLDRWHERAADRGAPPSTQQAARALVVVTAAVLDEVGAGG